MIRIARGPRQGTTVAPIVARFWDNDGVPPQVRARHPQTLLAILGEQHPAAHDKVMASLDCGDRLAHALPVEWLPIAVDIEVIDAVARALSPGEFDALIAERQRREMGSVLFKTFVSTITALFGLSPATFIRHLNRGWSQILLECGTIEVVRIEPRAGVALLRALPAECLASRAWIGSLVPGMRMLYELVHVAGDVTTERRGDDIELRFAW